jgi:cytidine deaminase
VSASFDAGELMRLAAEASAFAYAPYSRFSVGAALLFAGGEVVTGCNIENASYGLSMCAERVAMFKAVSAGLSEAVAVAVWTPAGSTPCGACRQVLWEFAPDVEVVLGGDELRVVPLRALLPEPFEL